jgi:hypothetical protein
LTTPADALVPLRRAFTALAVLVIFCAGLPVSLVIIVPALIRLVMALKCVKDI